MNYKIEDIKDITDSTEILHSKPEGFSKYMFYIITVLLSLVIVWSLFATKEVTIKANGVVRPSDNESKVSSSIEGKITKINITDGKKVKKGDILLSIDNNEYESQKSILDKTLKSKEKELDCNKKFKKSILDGINHFDLNNEDESNYYKMYELYSDNLKNGNAQSDSLDKQKQNLNKDIDNLNLFIKAVNDNKNYFDSNNYLYYQYKSYEMTINNYKTQIKNYEDGLKKLQNSNDKNTSDTLSMNADAAEIKQQQINTTKEKINATKNEMEKCKNDQIMNITNTIAQYKEKLNSEVASSTSGNYKEQYITQLDTTIKSLQTSIDELKANIDAAKSKISSTSIKAEANGVINLINELKIGDVISAGTQIASIVPENSSKLKVQIYIPSENLGDIKNNKDAILEFVSLPQREYGVMKTNLTNLSIDTKVSEKKEQSYYTATCNLPRNTMSNKKGNQVKIKNGMLVVARIVNRRVSYFRYFMEKINILD